MPKYERQATNLLHTRFALFYKETIMFSSFNIVFISINFYSKRRSQLYAVKNALQKPLFLIQVMQ